MYHEEKIIDGVLHWRNHPHGDFHPYTAEELTMRLTVAKRDLQEIKAKLEMVNL